jgi:CheY-like chemotaxis protein
MGHIGTGAILERVRDVTPLGIHRHRPVTHSVLVVRDDGVNNYLLDTVCEFLDIGIEYFTNDEDLGPMLRALRPMAIIADLAGEVRDGYHVMMTAAGYDRDLPVLLLTDKDPALLGAIDAVQEIWGLKRVATMKSDGDIGELVDFLCHAARDAGMPRMMRL